MRLIKNILSIDFDFFVPEDPMWDIGHRENEFFINKVWFTRPELIDKMKTTKDLEGFWSRLPFKYDTTELLVSESHCEAYNILTPPCNIILFDAHHDAYWDTFKKELKTRRVSCETWLGHAIQKEFVVRILWVVPDWYHNYYGTPPIEAIPEYFKHRFETVSLSRLSRRLEEIGVSEIDTAHLCRSGCWVAPWLDKEFIRFAHSGPFSEIVEIDEYHPLSERWTEEEFAALRMYGDQFEKFKKRIIERYERE